MLHKNIRLAAAACGFALSFFAVIADAQAQTVPPSAEPGIVTRSLESPDRSRQRLDDSITLPKMDDPKIEGSTEKVFVLNEVILDDATVYKIDDFKEITTPYVGQSVSFADLSGLAAAMTRKYREDGYIFSRVILPPQKIKDGVLHVRAIEGRVAKVEVTGNFKDSRGLVKKFADKISSDGPTNTRDIERYLLLIDDLPGLTARSFVRPSPTTPGGSDLVIVVEQDTFEASASIDNRGSRFIGPWRGELTGALNGVLGLHERTTLRAILASQTEELRFGEITHEQQIGAEGLRVKGRYAHTSTEPGGSLTSLGIQGDSDLYDLEALFPLMRSRNLNLNLLGGFNVNNTETDLSGVQIAKDRVRSLRFGGRLDFVDPLRGVSQFELMGTQGLDVLNATSDGTGRSRANGEHEFFRVNLTATRIQDLWLNNFSLLASATTQYTKDPLLASEEFAVGGGGFGRAYDSGELAGDKGYAGLAELRYSAAVNNDILHSYQLYTFVDYGKVKNIDPAVGESASDSLTSAGIGVRFNLNHGVSGYVEWDKPLNKEVAGEGDDDSRIFFNLLKRF